MKNIQLQSLIADLKKAAIEEDASIWKDVARGLEKPTKRRSSVNLSKINTVAKDQETIIVPGKVLSMGDLEKKVVIAAYNFSAHALDKIKANGSQAMSVRDLLKKNPKGSKVRIIG